MPEAFLGDLSQTKLFDIVKPLLVGAKTGIVTISGRENGEIFLDSGNIVHAKTGQSSGEEAFLIIMGWRMGKATFLSDLAPPKKTITVPTESLLLNWSYRKQEWEKIREVVPTPNAVFRLTLQKIPEDRSIKGDYWNILALSNGARTVAEIARILNGEEFKTSKLIYQLVQEGMLEKGEEIGPASKKLVKEKFFQTMEMELKKVMGPVASIIFEDEFTEFGVPKDAFPQDRVLPFLEALSEEIPNIQGRKEFKKAMIEHLSIEK
jgi:hypothetical protein